MIAAGLALTIEGETLVLHPERAVLWPARRTVIVADTHFGKSEFLRRHGMAVPAGADDRDRRRLSEIIDACDATRVLILGDFLHGPIEQGGGDAAALEEWCRAMPATQIHVVAGNHDRGALLTWRPPVHWHEGALLEPPFCFTHDAERAGGASGGLRKTGGPLQPGGPQHAGAFTLSGHVHPVARLGDRGRRSSRVPVFWQRARGLVLPSFGLFTGGFVVEPAPGERLFAVGPERVVAFPQRLSKG